MARECLRAGVSPTLGQLYWDCKSSKVYVFQSSVTYTTERGILLMTIPALSSIVGFKNSDLARPTDQWTDVEWVSWQLADCPVRDIWSGEVHGDKDRWTL